MHKAQLIKASGIFLLHKNKYRVLTNSQKKEFINIPKSDWDRCKLYVSQSSCK